MVYNRLTRSLIPFQSVVFDAFWQVGRGEQMPPLLVAACTFHYDCISSFDVFSSDQLIIVDEALVKAIPIICVSYVLAFVVTVTL